MSTKNAKIINELEFKIVITVLLVVALISAFIGLLYFAGGIVCLICDLIGHTVLKMWRKLWH